MPGSGKRSKPKTWAWTASRPRHSKRWPSRKRRSNRTRSGWPASWIGCGMRDVNGKSLDLLFDLFDPRLRREQLALQLLDARVKRGDRLSRFDLIIDGDDQPTEHPLRWGHVKAKGAEPLVRQWIVDSRNRPFTSVRGQ